MKGHAGETGNEEADKPAALGTQKEAVEDNIDLKVPAHTMTTGVKLTSVSQSLIYHHLKSGKDV